MGLEAVTHISDLNIANPLAGDPKSEGDDHIRNIKIALKTDFPNINGVVSATDEELSGLAIANLAEAFASIVAGTDWSLVGTSLRKITKDFAVLSLNATPTAGTAGTSIATLPVGYRPGAITYAAATFIDLSTGIAYSGYVQIGAAGGVSFFTGSATPFPPAAIGDKVLANVVLKLA